MNSKHPKDENLKDPSKENPDDIFYINYRIK